MRVALVCSWLNQYGGAERVLEAVHEIWPQAPVYTSIHDPEALPDSWRAWDIRPSWMNRLPGVISHHRLYLPVYAAAFESMRLRGYDLVLSVSSGFASAAHGDGQHVCYCLTPPRFLWGLQGYVERENLRAWQQQLLPLVLAALRAWDRRAAARVGHFIAISREVQGRIAQFYNRQASIIYPPVDVGRFQIQQDIDEYFLVVSRLVPYKRIDLAVRVCTELGLPLKVVGEGRARQELEMVAGPSVEFLGWQPDEEVTRLIERCRALLWPGLEDFGITPLEAMAAGRPVVAYAGGGALETIIDGKTGILFAEQTEGSLWQALERLNESHFEPQRLREHALQFDKSVFQQRLREYVGSLESEGNANHR
ncbi:MAG: glycosyltransferase [Anaerolineae bacterium]